MKKILFLLTLFLFNNVYAESYSCLSRAELGESKEGGNLYDRSDESNIKYLSKFDFENLILISTDGESSKILRLESDLYKLSSGGKTWYFVTSEDKSIITETSINNLAVYIKVLF